ncbi:MAG: hypothetical protein AAGF77_14520 [Bacteroidota bacterium]
MANIRDLKKDINFVLGDIIEAVYQWEADTNNHNSEAGNAIVDNSIAAFDEIMAKVHEKEVADKKAHFAAVRNTLEDKATTLIEALNDLGKA